jgi:uncharacterized protein (TIGR02594 family)
MNLNVHKGVIARHAQACRSNLARQRRIASAATQVGLARLAHTILPISGKPEIGGRLAMTRAKFPRIISAAAVACAVATAACATPRVACDDRVCREVRIERVAHQAAHAIQSPVRHARARPVAHVASSSANAPPAASIGGSLVDEARRWIGATAAQLGVRRTLWCAAAVNKWLANLGMRGTGSDMAASFAHYGRRLSGPAVGAIAVSKRRGGDHVGVVSGFAANGAPIIISGNCGGRVCESTFMPGPIYAYVDPWARSAGVAPVSLPPPRPAPHAAAAQRAPIAAGAVETSAGYHAAYLAARNVCAPLGFRFPGQATVEKRLNVSAASAANPAAWKAGTAAGEKFAADWRSTLGDAEFCRKAQQIAAGIVSGEMSAGR